MMLVSDFPTRPDLDFDGTFVLNYSRQLAKLRDGRVLGIGVEDTSGSTEVLVRVPHSAAVQRGPRRKQLRHLRLRTIATRRNGASSGVVNAVIVGCSKPCPGKLIASTMAASVQSTALHRLDRILDDALTLPAVRTFVRDVFSDSALRDAFITASASRDYHHAYPGGLLVHSVDIVERLAAVTHDEPDALQRQCALVVGLLHDVGKLAPTLVGRHGIWASEHALLNTHLVDTALSRLKFRDKEAWGTMLHLFHVVAGIVAPGRMPVGLLLQSLDRYSAARDGKRLAFARSRQADRIASIQPSTGGANRVFIRSRECRGTSVATQSV
ncbi:hypothetical protein J2T57_004464 [Natronocella acetinitrilica]|uniref:HD domain-containing protein n=1 Tax=Natronocella acetinitrilica TaxID=414046 RepID=A0AAE3KCR3_9GAMM|nr:hypothetical protein [Natronocella acetinitrilica]MCP1677285.1 hypothetical protein [Natronocella acetinitrilica]